MADDSDQNDFSGMEIRFLAIQNGIPYIMMTCSHTAIVLASHVDIVWKHDNERLLAVIAQILDTK